MMCKKTLQLLPLVGLLAFALNVAAQEAAGEMPVYSGKSKVTEAVNSKNGAVFNIGGGVSITLPRGLPIGQSRVLTLKKCNQKPKPSQIHKRFARHGQTVIFDGALNAPDKPIIFAMSMKKEPKKKGKRFVLAMEEIGLCTEENKKYKVGKGLCSTWRIFDTEYDLPGNRVIAKLSSTGGRRLQFGWIPETD